jgi:uncharacterized protein YgiM (DUF1202 family)
MKTNPWFLLAVMLSTGLLAQQAADPSAGAGNQTTTTTTAPSKTDAPAGGSARKKAPAESAAKKKTARKPATATKAAPRKSVAAELRSAPLTPGPAVVVARNVNVRGQPSFKGEVVGQVTRGQTVTVLEEITLKNSEPNEPSAWAKIHLPQGVNVWVHTMFLEADGKTVKARKLNLRSGPGENYSVLGILQRGNSVKDISTKGDWMEIEAPPDAYAYVAASYLTQEPASAGSLAATTGVTPGASTTSTTAETPAASPATTTAATETPPVAAATPESPATPAPAAAATAATTPPAGATQPAGTNAPAAATTDESEAGEDGTPPKRIVQREGIVRGTVSIQAPSHFELVSAENGKVINYLYTTSPYLDLRRYKGLHIIVTGEEGLDERWRSTPVITIEKIEVLE